MALGGGGLLTSTSSQSPSQPFPETLDDVIMCDENVAVQWLKVVRSKTQLRNRAIHHT